ncbi:MAG: glycosyl transferase family 4 [Pseudomonadota bacterium]
MSALVGMIGSALLSALAVAIYLRSARRRGWLDAPNHRSSHEEATPSSGGIAVLGVLVPLAALWLILGTPAGTAGTIVPIREPLLSLAAAALLCLIGAWDDLRPLPAGLRLMVFVGLTLMVVAVWLPPRELADLALVLILGVALAWLVNLYNFMDGIDGLAALQCVLVALAMAWLARRGGANAQYEVFALLIAGSYLGFLLFNRPPARLFMGDAGSLSAGLLLGCLGLWAWREAWVPATAWLLLMSPFLVDTGWTLAARAFRGAPLAEAHREHGYQRLARHWQSHGFVDLALLGLFILWLFPLTLLQQRMPENAVTIFLLGLFPQLLLMVRLRRLQ